MVKKKKKKEAVSGSSQRDVNSRRSFTSVRSRSPPMRTPQRGNYLQLMPTHQLHRSAHSCHLDHFLLQNSLSPVQRAASRRSRRADSIKAGAASSGPRSLAQEGDSGEMCQSADP